MWSREIILLPFLYPFFIYLFLTVLGICCYSQAFSSSVSRGYSLAAVRRLLIGVVSLTEEHGLWCSGFIVAPGLVAPQHVGS